MNEFCNLVSVVMPVYNCEKYVEESIRSVLEQTYEEFEIIAIDDASTDNSLTILKELEHLDHRLRVIENKLNIGVSKTRNKGIEMAKGEWIAFLDSDDIWCPKKLEAEMVKRKERADCVLFYTATFHIRDDGYMYDYVLPAEEVTSYSLLLRKNIISCSSILVKKEVIQKYLMCGDAYIEDYVSWLRITRDYGPACGINIPLLKYRITPNSRSRNQVKNAYRMIKSYHFVGVGFLKSVYYTLRYAIYKISYSKKLYG